MASQIVMLKAQFSERRRVYVRFRPDSEFEFLQTKFDQLQDK
jgi:hypothetical protein